MRGGRCPPPHTALSLRALLQSFSNEAIRRAEVELRPYTKKPVTQGGLMWTSAPTMF